jgi:anti-sigma B factor antagonist
MIMENLSIQTRTNGSVAVMTLIGRIDSETSPTLDAELTKVVGGNVKLVLDLKGVEYMSSAGIRAVVKAAQATEKAGGALKLASAPESVQSILYTVGMLEKVKTYSTVNEAIGSF